MFRSLELEGFHRSRLPPAASAKVPFVPLVRPRTPAQRTVGLEFPCCVGAEPVCLGGESKPRSTCSRIRPPNSLSLGSRKMAIRSSGPEMTVSRPSNYSICDVADLVDKGSFRLIERQINDPFVNVVGNTVLHTPRLGTAVFQCLRATCLIAVIPAIERCPRDAACIQCAFGWQVRLLNEPDDLKFLRMRDTSFDILPSPIMLF